MANNDKNIKSNTRLYITLSFFFMFIIGIPIWWKSTEIYRAELPYNEINQYDPLQPYNTRFLIALDIYYPNKLNRNINNDKESILKYINKENNKYLYKQSYNTQYSINIHKTNDLDNLSLYSCLSIDNWMKEQNIQSQNGKYSFILLPNYDKTLSTFIICPSRVVLMNIDYNNIDNNKSEEIFKTISQILIHKLVQPPITEEKSRKKIQSNSGFRLTFSVLQDAEGWDFPIRSWDFPYFANGILQSFINEINDTTNISFDSQIKYFVKLQKIPEYNGNEYYFNSSMLPYILSHPNEWNSDFIATTEPSLHFIVYIPSKQYTPLVLKEENNNNNYNAFIIPQTGGIIIYNRKDNGTLNNLSFNMMDEFIGIFIEQLRELYGLSPLNDLSFIDNSLSIEIIPSLNGISKWEKDQLIRERTVENLHLTISNLQSLSELVQKLTNMMISDEIQQIVIESIESMNNSFKNINNQQYNNAQKHSLKAMTKSHEAFFDPDMLSLLYFPDEHKFAIYTPLFLPISIPMFLKLIGEIKKTRKKKNKAKKSQKEKKNSKKEKIN